MDMPLITTVGTVRVISISVNVTKILCQTDRGPCFSRAQRNSLRLRRRFVFVVRNFLEGEMSTAWGETFLGARRLGSETSWCRFV